MAPKDEKAKEELDEDVDLRADTLAVGGDEDVQIGKARRAVESDYQKKRMSRFESVTSSETEDPLNPKKRASDEADAAPPKKKSRWDTSEPEKEKTSEWDEKPTDAPTTPRSNKWDTPTTGKWKDADGAGATPTPSRRRWDAAATPQTGMWVLL